MSSSPLPPLVVMLRVVCDEGTVILKYCQLFSAPERPVTGRAEVSVVTPPPPPEVTVSVTVVACDLPPPVPVTVMGYVPAGVEADVVIVRPDVPEPGAAIDAGLNAALAPVGRPVVVNATEELKPPETAVVIVDTPAPPWATETAMGLDEIVKSGLVPGLKMMSRTAWISMPFGATPVCPCRKSNM